MNEKHWIDDHHYQVHSPDGRRAYLYRVGDTDAQPPRMLEVLELSRRRAA